MSELVALDDGDTTTTFHGAGEDVDSYREWYNQSDGVMSYREWHIRQHNNEDVQRGQDDLEYSPVSENSNDYSPVSEPPPRSVAPDNEDVQPRQDNSEYSPVSDNPDDERAPYNPKLAGSIFVTVSATVTQWVLSTTVTPKKPYFQTAPQTMARKKKRWVFRHHTTFAPPDALLSAALSSSLYSSCSR
jgi:hypothetical protein